jgi:F-type H+-transporting ATPase subunit alpha
MKQVAGKIKLELAQYREMAAFAQFASDLDASTQRLLARGARLTELLKQPQFSPMPVEDQVVSIFTGVRGYLDKIPTGDVVRYEAKMLGEAKAKIPEVFESIRTKREIVSETEEKLKAFLETFTKNFA